MNAKLKPEKRDIPLSVNVEVENRVMEHLERNFLNSDDPRFLDIKPFPYMVMDSFLPEGVCEFIEIEGRRLDSSSTFMDNTHVNSRKRAEHRFWQFDKPLYEVVSIFYSERFVSFLEKLTGIKGIISDSYYNWGGGLHFLPQGGYLNIHKDFNIHPFTNDHRRLNLLIYLNKGWTEKDGGQLEFWDMESNEQLASIVPVFNRAGLFETSEISYHGNPQKVTRGDGYDRMALNLYYYTKTRPNVDTIAEHTTVYVDLPGQHLNKVRNVARLPIFRPLLWCFQILARFRKR